MKIVIIDNYDSFTYNLSHLIKELGAEVTVLRNDCFHIEDLEKFDKIVLSPGPGIPSEAGLLLDVIKNYAGRKPILGVCLGEQAIGEVFGGSLINLDTVFHGIQSPVEIVADDYIFCGLPHTRRTLSLVGSRHKRFSHLSGNYSQKSRRIYHGIAPPSV